MPNTESVKKSLRQSQHRRARNLSQKKALKEVVRDFKKAAESKPEEATKMLSGVYKKLDKAAKKNLIHKNRASRLKSRLTQRIAKSSKTDS
ncbi:TPA: 30S ribosomal protein S20 [Patescibacteria group bacterium]|nr:30S ribosomal protein S20 [Patescibacteria group bacterium]|tara:strand:+ start:1421 stop:1693 length:273 start_codon:yes stop_codon:yes gene_type:complete